MASSTVAGQRARRRGGSIALKIFAGLIVIIALLIVFWDWDWFIPIVDSQASAALGRKVTIQHLNIGLGRTTTVTVSGIAIANPNGYTPPAADPPDFATVDRLILKVDVMAYIRHQVLSLTTIELDHPTATVRQLPDGQNNYTLSMGGGNKSAKSSSKPPELGDLIINDGSAAVIMPRYKTDFDLAIQTRQAPPDDKLFTDGEIVVDAKGTYAAAPITGRFIGGALLSLRDPATPYPIDLHIQNGTTTASLVGTIENPETFAGAHLKLSFAGQNMADLYQLTGVPIPATPPFSLTGNLDYSKSAIRFDDFSGRVGSSDLEGSIAEIPGSPRRQINADLTSRRVDLTDLAGFLGGTPGKTTTPGQDAATREKVAAANASPSLLPEQTFNLPKINIANVDLRYRGEHIINRDVPLDNIEVHLIIKDGRITVDPLNFGVGGGTVASDFDLDPVDNVLHTRANIDFRRLSLARLMAATHSFAGSGTVGGSAHLVTTGNSVATMLGRGNGGLQLFMQHGGNVSALLVDLAGLQVGDAILSALGVPNQTNVQCLVSDFVLTDGVVDTKALLLATPEANILGDGSVNLAAQTLDLHLHTDATHFSIGSLSTPINIGGTLKHPSVLPAPGPLAARAVPAVGLGVLFPPLALLPTIRLGLGDKNACADTMQNLREGNPHNAG
jgi:uncharacterized protein involved in outer membrane biogenesis